jgi:hypothetical protein
MPFIMMTVLVLLGAVSQAQPKIDDYITTRMIPYDFTTPLVSAYLESPPNENGVTC